MINKHNLERYEPLFSRKTTLELSIYLLFCDTSFKEWSSRIIKHHQVSLSILILITISKLFKCYYFATSKHQMLVIAVLGEKNGNYSKNDNHDIKLLTHTYYDKCAYKWKNYINSMLDQFQWKTPIKT